MKQLQKMSSHSSTSLRTIIHYWLDRAPRQPQVMIAARYCVFDGSFTYKRSAPVAALLDGVTGKLIACKYGVNENSQPALLRFFRELQEQGLHPLSCTVDGNLHVIRVLKMLWPNIRIQRCRVHVQRQGLMWCRVHPKTTMGKQLRQLFIDLLKIHSIEEQIVWVQRVEQWERRFGPEFPVAPRGWVMSDLKNARTMLLKALPDLFHHMTDPLIPASTNRAEGFFSTLKRSYKRHTGLALHQRKNFITWYCFFLTSPPYSTHF